MSAWPAPPDSTDEIQALLATLRATECRLDELTGEQVDAITNSDGRTFLLQRAQEGVRRSDAERREAILNSLPANIALLDSSGVIVAVNEAWKQFGDRNGLAGLPAGVGANYLDVCLKVRGEESDDASRAAHGLLSVIDGAEKSFDMEYPCHSPEQQRWFRLTATPLSETRWGGVVVMHMDITERVIHERASLASALQQQESARRLGQEHARLVAAQVRIERLNRGYLMLSQISALVARVSYSDELYREACRIAVESGGLRLAWIGTVDRAKAGILPVASSGASADFMQRLGAEAVLDQDTAPALGPAALAVRSGQPVVDNNVGCDVDALDSPADAVPGPVSTVALPILLAGEVVAVLNLHAGGADYFDAAEIALIREVANEIGFAVDHIGKTQQINYLAYFDSLTGLANRSLFLERAAQGLRAAADAGRNAALVLIDVERFKRINDSLGVHAGDDLLKQVGAWLGERLDDPGLLARVGSDHFAVMLADTHAPDEAVRTLERLIHDFHEHPFPLDGTPFRIAAKFGVAMFPDDATSAAGLFQKAESALKNAKASGTRKLFYTQKMTDSIARKLGQENQLRYALDNEEFEIHYQPKMNLLSGKVIGAEALIRWNDSRTGTMVHPAEFIPILEETGLIMEVGRWAMRRAIEDYLRWLGAGLPAVRIAVNVSALQLRDPQFVEQVRELVSVDERAAGGLELEITESMIMTDIEESMETLSALRALGVRIAIDDFGTGFSSLGYLSKLPVDTLKIDRSFVDKVCTSQQGQTLVSTIITLAHSFGLEVVAEGVETVQQASMLNRLGCDEAQGYLFSRPLPCGVFEANFLGRVDA